MYNKRFDNIDIRLILNFFFQETIEKNIESSGSTISTVQTQVD